MASSEDRAYEIMRELDVNYVLVIFGGLTGYASDGKVTGNSSFSCQSFAKFQTISVNKTMNRCELSLNSAHKAMMRTQCQTNFRFTSVEHLARVVQRMDKDCNRVNRYPADTC